MKKHAIVGFGCAGYHAAKAIRGIDGNCIIDVYSDHEEAPYNPMLTTYHIGGKIARDEMFPFGNLNDISEELGLNIRTNTHVAGISAPKREVRLKDGVCNAYDTILISTGARAFVPPAFSVNDEGVFYMRTQKDADKLLSLLGDEMKKPETAVVVGASMVGIKVAEVLCGAGVETTLVDMADHIFPLSAYPDVAAAISDRITDRGVRQIYGTGIAATETGEDGRFAVLSNGSRLPAELLVLCIGTSANTDIVSPDEIECGRAIRVDAGMRTSATGIYAAGDCCEGLDIQAGDRKVIGLWSNAGMQGRCAGVNMAGGVMHYGGNILHNITHFMDMDFIGMGDNRLRGDEITLGSLSDGGMFIKAFLQNGSLVGVNILNNCRVSGIIKNYFIRLLEGRVNEITPLQRGILHKEGLSHSFIDKMEACI